MLHAQRAQQALARRGQPDAHLAPVLIRNAARDCAAVAQPVDQLDCAVMPDLQAPGELLNGGSHPGWEPLDSQQQLVLLRLQSVRPGGFLAVSQKPADLMTELRQCAVSGRREILLHYLYRITI